MIWEKVHDFFDFRMLRNIHFEELNLFLSMVGELFYVAANNQYKSAQ